MRLRTGTSGFAYKEWKGNFYPQDLPNTKMLDFYSSTFDSVEINNTFYRLPKQEVLEKWRSEVPDDFSFVLKASRRITHFKRLKDEASEPLTYMAETAMAGLGANLGPILFQLPPNFKKDLERLQGFLRMIPHSLRTAFEFRNPTWFEDDVYDVLREAGAALVLADTEEDEAPLVATADFGYARLRRPDYDEAALAGWAKAFKSQPWSEAFVFFKHEDDGAGPAMAKQFRVLWDAP